MTKNRGGDTVEKLIFTHHDITVTAEPSSEDATGIKARMMIDILLSRYSYLQI